MSVRDPDPSETGGSSLLVVTGDGSTAVSTDELFALAARLHALAEDAAQWGDALNSVEWAGVLSAGARDAVGEARRCVASVAADARDVATALDRSAWAYGTIERGAARTAEAAAGALGWLVGALAPVLAPGVIVGGAVIAAELALAWFAVVGVRRLLGLPTELDVRRLLADNSRLLNNPVTVTALRMLVSSLDDVAAGAAHLPGPLARLLDDAGVTGPRSSALGALVLGGMFGVLRESAVAVHRVDASGRAVPTAGGSAAQDEGSRTAAPAGIGELLARTPPSIDDTPQVRIERYGTGEAPQWIVYIGGTVGWDLSASTEPWDLVSDVHGLAGGDPGSFRAVQDAMRQAGVVGGDAVIAVGHSQGGLLAAMLAADDAVRCTGLVTAGAPIAGVPLPPGVPVLQIEHSDDAVPALAGWERTDTGAGRLLVRREFLTDGAPEPGSVVPAHELTGYRQTAALIDASPDPRLQAMGAEIRELTGSGRGTTTWWRGERTRDGGVSAWPAAAR